MIIIVWEKFYIHYANRYHFYKYHRNPIIYITSMYTNQNFFLNCKSWCSYCSYCSASNALPTSTSSRLQPRDWKIGYHHTDTGEVLFKKVSEIESELCAQITGMSFNVKGKM